MLTDQDGYVAFVQSHLEPLSAKMIAQFQFLLAQPLHPDVVMLDIEVFPNGLVGKLPARLFLMDELNSEVLGDDDDEFLTSSVELLPEIQYIVPPEERAFERVCSEVGVDTLEIDLKEVIAWLTRCWDAAVGAQLDKPAYICIHDDVRSFNLLRRQWTRDEDDKNLHFAE